jgi:hypothetical protein
MSFEFGRRWLDPARKYRNDFTTAHHTPPLSTIFIYRGYLSTAPSLSSIRLSTVLIFLQHKSIHPSPVPSVFSFHLLTVPTYLSLCQFTVSICIEIASIYTSSTAYSPYLLFTLTIKLRYQAMSLRRQNPIFIGIYSTHVSILQ